MLRAVRTALEDAREQVSADQVVCRVALSGATALAWQLRRDHDLLSGELQALAEDVGACWIEAVELDVRPAGRTDAREDIGALAELSAIIEQDVLSSHAYRAELRETLSGLMAQLPREVRDLLGTDEAEEEALLSAAAARGASEVIPKLAAEREGDRP